MRTKKHTKHNHNLQERNNKGVLGETIYPQISNNTEVGYYTAR